MHLTEPFPYLQLLLVMPLALSAAAFLLLGIGWLLGWDVPEKFTGSVTVATYSLTTLATLALAFEVLTSGQTSVSVSFGQWFTVHNYRFPLVLLGDRLSIPMMALTSILMGLVAAFSRRYLHREKGFGRFFLLLNLFGFGSLLAFAAGSFDLLIGGWDLVGITSVLLIAFFQERREPVANATRVSAIYRATDIGLLVGVFLLHHAAGTASYADLFQGQWPLQQPVAFPALLAGLLFLLAAAGKAAQVPFSGWLPRAMEGPTPSSAIFYGAISVHAGAYLLLRCAPILESSRFASAAVILIGAITAIIGTLAGRTSADAKTALAHGALAQLGLIFIEIGLGWYWLALAHILGHATVRTLEFLRAPSMLHDYHRMHSAAGGHMETPGLYYEALLPSGIRDWLYRFALDRGHVDTLLDRFAVAPLVAVAKWLAEHDRRFTDPQGPLARQKRRVVLPLTQPAQRAEVTRG